MSRPPIDRNKWWQKEAEKPGPVSSIYNLEEPAPREYPPTAVQTTECLVTLLWMILAICLAAKASEFLTAIRDFILKLKGKS
jgi:hypothetical protein